MLFRSVLATLLILMSASVPAKTSHTTKAKSAPPQDPVLARRSIERANQDFIVALKKPDMKAIADAFEPDAVLLSPGMDALHGREAIAKFFAAFVAHTTIVETSAITTDVTVSDQTAYETGLYTMTTKAGDADEHADHGKYLVVWYHDDDGHWRIARDISNSSVASATGALAPAATPVPDSQAKDHGHDTAASAAHPKLDVLNWLSGSWNLVDGDRHVEEIWTAPSSNLMVGMGRTVRGDKTAFFEFLRIAARDDGVFYIAQPRGKPPVEFPLQSWDGTSAVFVNAGSDDHLKRIVYRRNADGSMTARVEGSDNGKDFAQEYAYARAVVTRVD
jgi:uncharacterized protein (TIGR02246 family)